MVLISITLTSNAPKAKRHNYRSITTLEGSVDYEPMTDKRIPTTPMELLISAEKEWLRRKCSYEAYLQGIKIGVKINPEDLFVEVVAKAIKSQHTYTDMGKTIKPWLSKIAENHAKTLAQKAKKQQMNEAEISPTNEDGEEFDLLANIKNPGGEVMSLEAQLMSEEEIAIINDAIAQLNPAFAEVIRLNIVEGYTYIEISKMLDIPINTVSTRVSRGREDLRVVLKDLAAEHGITGKKKEK